MELEAFQKDIEVIPSSGFLVVPVFVSGTAAKKSPFRSTSHDAPCLISFWREPRLPFWYKRPSEEFCPRPHNVHVTEGEWLCGHGLMNSRSHGLRNYD